MITLSKLDVIILGSIIFLIIVFVYTHFFSGKTDNSQTANEVEIHEVIEKVRSELKQADENRISRNEPALFAVKSFDLEINFIAKSVVKQDGSLKTELFAVSGGTESSVERLQKITLRLETLPPKDIDVPPSDETKTSNKKTKDK